MHSVIKSDCVGRSGNSKLQGHSRLAQPPSQQTTQLHLPSKELSLAQPIEAYESTLALRSVAKQSKMCRILLFLPGMVPDSKTSLRQQFVICPAEQKIIIRKQFPDHSTLSIYKPPPGPGSLNPPPRIRLHAILVRYQIVPLNP